MKEENWEDECEHEPNWDTLTVSRDGDNVYLDVNCINCGTSGCLGIGS